MFLGLTPWGGGVFETQLSPVQEVTEINIDRAIFDELSLRDEIYSPIEKQKDHWEYKHRVLARFDGSLEAGNVHNEGMRISHFNVMRREFHETDWLKVGEFPYTTSSLDFIDYLQPNARLVYAIVPVSANGIEGRYVEIDITSKFSGWWVVNHDNSEPIGFDKTLGSGMDSIDVATVENRKVLETFSKYPQVYYVGDTQYSTFSLTSLALPRDSERTGALHKRIMQDLIENRSPKIVKGDNGQMYVCDIANLNTSTPKHTWDGHDYIQITVDCLEIMSMEEFLEKKALGEL